MATEQLPDGDTTRNHAVVFGLYPTDPKFYTVVERAAESGGAPGTPTVVAWLAPGVKHYTEIHRATASFSYYRFYHQGFGFDAGEPTAWYRARPVEWNGEIPNLPREALLDLDLVLDDATGDVDIVANGGRRVRSIEWGSSTSSFPTEPSTAVNTDAEGDVTVSDAFTLSAGQTGYVTVQFFDQVSGGGNLLGTLRSSTTMPTTGEADPDTTFGTLVLNGDFEHATDGAYWTTNFSGGTGSVSIESASPLTGSKSLKIVSATDGAVSTVQTANSSGFGPIDEPRQIPVAPGEAFELRCAGQGQSGFGIRLRAVEYDEDKAFVDAEIIAAFGATVNTLLRTYTVPDGVRYVTWQVQVPTDASGPRNFYFDNLTVRRVDRLERGLPAALSKGGTYYINESQVTVDSSGGVEGSDPGYLYWGPNAWKFIHPNGTKYTVPADSVTLLSLDGSRLNTADVMCYVGSNTSRFTGLADTAMRRIVGVRKLRSGLWEYLGDSAWAVFTPNTNDALMAEPALTSEVV